jgi:hypothetical protein
MDKQDRDEIMVIQDIDLSVKWEYKSRTIISFEEIGRAHV